MARKRRGETEKADENSRDEPSSPRQEKKYRALIRRTGSDEGIDTKYI